MSRAIQFNQYGGVEVLRVDEVPDAVPAAGQVRLAVRAAGVNPVDWKILHGYMASVIPLEFPAGLGSDVAGVVEELGAGVTRFAVGDEVLGSAATPAYAERALALEEKLTRRPPGVPWEIAGSLAVVIGTAYKTLAMLAVADGETLLVHAASGGVGLAAVQLAVARGVRVIGTAGESNHELLREAGAEPVLYGNGLPERVRALAPEGVDAVLDASGRGELAVSVELAGGPERVLTIAAQDAAEHGVHFHGGGGGEDTVKALEEVLPLIEAGTFIFPIAGTFALEEAGAAFEESESGHARGKLVIMPA
ncbi:MAG TPA: NADP-dependent oxidoreductase [Solirubrobacteraceae bacterium]|jgi:NADPH:quinone reductase-like Zn-dependent oxidoreductase